MIKNGKNRFINTFSAEYLTNSFSSAMKTVIYGFFLQDLWKFGVFDKFLYFNAMKNLETLRDVFGYSKNIFSWENISKYAKSGCFSK